jgi:serine/threonine protein kinase
MLSETGGAKTMVDGPRSRRAQEPDTPVDEIHSVNCPRCHRPWGDRLICDQDGTLRHGRVIVGQRYELTDLLGASSMGFVYEARHIILGKKVAVKILRSELCNTPGKVRQLLEQIQLRSQVKHENIAEVNDFGRDKGLGLYLVRELLNGNTLADLLAVKGRLPAKRALDILRQVCRALDAAHTAGVAHRNLTPRNIFLSTESGRPDMVKVLDFALSRADVSTTSEIGTVGETVLSTAYRAPEQLQGNTGQDHRVDIYALGVIAHEMFTGELPFSSVTRTDLMLEKMAEVELRDLREIAPTMAELVAECLSTSPNRRPASTGELEQRLFSSGGRLSVQPEDLEGVRAGSYRLVKLLGKGGLGSVWLGEHPVIASKVAIKILHPEMCDSEEAVRRFVVEAQAVNRIDSPHIVKTFDFGKLPDKRDYAVMELLEGETLADRLERRGHLDWPQVSQIATQLLHALQSAHAAGIVHRDLKPENIHLGDDEDDPKVKILDFGIAKLMDGEAGEMNTTKRGFCIGTPLYAAPEQMLGESIGPATDIYAFGVVLYEMLMGQPPFTGGLKEVVKAKLERHPEPPADLVGGLPDWVQRLVEALLTAHPDGRPTAAQVLALLEGDISSSTDLMAQAVVAPPGVDPNGQRQFADLQTVQTPTSGLRQATPSFVGSDTLPDSIPVVDLLEDLELEPDLEGLLPPEPLVIPRPVKVAPRRRKLAILITLLAGLTLGAGAIVAWSLAMPGLSLTELGARLTGDAPVGPDVVTTMANAVTEPSEPQPKALPALETPEKATAIPEKKELTPAATRKATPAAAPAKRERPAQPVTRDAGRLITIRSTPQGARVKMDGKVVGRTPLRIRITRHSLPLTLTFQRQGYETEERVLRRGDLPRRLKVTLQQDTTGWVDPFGG